MKNISAYTETTGTYAPGYISINEIDDANVTITVRSAGNQGASFVRMTREELSELCKPCVLPDAEPKAVEATPKSKRGE